MNAVVSGHSGVALLIEGNTFSSVHFGEDEIRPRRPGDFRLLFNGARDLQFLENVELGEVWERLHLESTRIDALHLALILLDRELAHDTRRTAAEELEELLADEAILRWVERVLHAHPLPRSADPVGAHSACTGRTERARAFLTNLESHQPAIAEIHHAWEVIPTHVFGTDEERQHALSVAVRQGLFRGLVAIRATGQPLEDFVLKGRMNPALQEVRNSKQILLRWVTTLRKTQTPWSVKFDVSSMDEDRKEGEGESPEKARRGGIQRVQPPRSWTPSPSNRGGRFIPSGAEPRVSSPEAPSWSRDFDGALALDRAHGGELGETLEELFRRFHSPVVFFFNRRGFSTEESRDLAQETFLRLYKNMEVFRKESSAGTWLFEIAANLYKNTLLSQSTQRRHGLGERLAPSADAVAGERLYVEDYEEDSLVRILNKERAQILRQAIDELPPQMRQAVILRVDGDLKYREIADVMHVSIETVKAHLYQARQHLRDKLGAYFSDVER
ncbi:MAG TPA: sigma-70 family RNA polymerase sigma factor [Thermoanaerobaculia bacterium]|nr:sigma-70 family RNA polymerase sigma factor [Thermoanaerobaculia bacterium]